ncbi:hypothetical protein ABH926_004315 [Catenulispora sp. GP43]|uniref:trypco2 family protein n=1 Tax=Catenulispora sp. GP43 TaxID=3156263 RepID=UPI00351262D4
MEVTSESVTIRTLVEVIKASICEVQGAEEPRPGDLIAASAALTLHAMMDTTVGGKVDLRVPVIGAHLRIGGRRARHRMHTVHVSLVPEHYGRSQHDHGAGDPELVMALRAIRDLMDATGRGGHSWTVAGGTVQVSFAVTDEGSISVGLNSDRSDEHVHSLELELQPVDSDPAVL